jgi:hypothetical protein
MASTINASTSAGLVSTADTSGVLQLQTAGTTAVSIDASQAVTFSAGTANGVSYLNGSKVLTTGSALTFDGNANLSTGGANPTTYNTLNVNNTASNGYSRILFNIGASGANGVGGVKYAPGLFFAIGTDSDSSSTPMTFNLNGSEQMRLTSTGLGIGTSSPAAVLHTSSSGVTNSIFATTRASGAFIQYALGASGATIGYVGSAGQLTSGTTADFAVRAESNLVFASGSGTERARIDSSGNLLVGTSSTVNSGKTTIAYNGATNNGLSLSETANTSGCTYVGFYQGSSVIGNIARVGATSAVIYNTTSDYRLKTVIGTVSGHGERIDALKPVEYTWNSDGSRTRGFLAHQFQEVYENSVSGTKDAVDADGNPKYQAMQAATSEVIADLVAEIQSLRIRIAQLEAK